MSWELRLLDMGLEVVPPEVVVIRLPEAEQERSLQLVLHMIWYENDAYGVYVCDSGTNTALPGSQIYMLGHGQYWYACEGEVVVNELKIHRSCFRTRDAFYKSGEHLWQTNLSRHMEDAEGAQNEEWWQGDWQGPEMKLSTQIHML